MNDTGNRYIPNSEYERPLNSVLPPYTGSLKYACRSVKEKKVNTGVGEHVLYISTGLFEDPTGRQNQATLKKALCFYVDFDYSDSLIQSNDVVLQFYEMLKTSGDAIFDKGGKRVDLDSLDLDNKADKETIVKSTLSFLPMHEVKERVEKAFQSALERYIIPFIGKPSIITFTGHGGHAYYWIDSKEGFTGAEGNREALKKGFKALLANSTEQAGFQIFDPKTSDVGTRITRELGSWNRKNTNNPKQVQVILETITEKGRFLTESDCKFPSSSFIDKVDKGGRPKKFKPALIKHDSSLKVLVNGEERYLTVGDFQGHFDSIMEEQGQSTKVRDVRLIDVLGSDGSCNAYAVKGEEGGILFFLTADKYREEGDTHWKQLSSGEYVGVWFFDGHTFTLTRDDKGKVLNTPENRESILQFDPRTKGKVIFNSRLNRVFLHKEIHLEVFSGVKKEIRNARTRKWFDLQDAHYPYFKKLFSRDYGLHRVSTTDIDEVLKSVSYSYGVDPVCDWVEKLKWDGVRRLETWLPSIFGMNGEEENYPLYSAYGRSVMLAVMRNIFVGNDFPSVDHTLLLKGGQGVGKSFFSRTLAGTDYIGRDYYHDSGINMSGHQGDAIESIQGCFMLELPEAISLGNNEDTKAIKRFLTKQVDMGRGAYQKNATRNLRATYFVTNSNDHVMLQDATGSRRFLVVDLHSDLKTSDGRIDVLGLRKIIPQLYREAYERVVLGNVPKDREDHVKKYDGKLVEDWNLSLLEQSQQQKLNEKFTVSDVVSDYVKELLHQKIEDEVYIVSQTFINQQVKEAGYKNISNARFSNVMQRSGWNKVRKDGRNVWQYQKESTVQVSTPRLDENRLLKEELEKLKKQLNEMQSVPKPAPIPTPVPSSSPVSSMSEAKDKISMMQEGDKKTKAKAFYERLLELEKEGKTTEGMYKTLYTLLNT